MSDHRFINFSDPFSFDDPTVKRIIDRATALGRKLNYSDVDGSTTCRIIASWYAYQYNGTFEYMQNMHKNVEKYQLSASQIAGTLNCMINDYRYAQKRQAEQAASNHKPFTMPQADLPDLTKPVIPDPVSFTQATLSGTYSILLDEAGDYRVIQLIDAPESYNKPAGTQIARYQHGPDNENDFTGFAFVFGTQIAMWKKFKSDSKLNKALQVLLTSDREAQIDLGHAYALASGNCFACGRKLTVPASISRGLGPICAGKFGL